MTLLLDSTGAEIPDEELPSNAAESADCPKCGQDKRQTVRGFGRHWKELCGNCGHLFASGTGVPPMEDR